MEDSAPITVCITLMPRRTRAARRHRSSTCSGRRVIPGLNDSHLHVIRAGLYYNLELRWDGVPSLADALRRLKEQAQRTPPPHWVRVIGGWNEWQFAEKTDADLGGTEQGRAGHARHRSAPV